MNDSQFNEPIKRVDPRLLKQLGDKYKIPEPCRNLWLNELRISNLKQDESAKKDAEILGIL
jgi:hypothetical protein